MHVLLIQDLGLAPVAALLARYSLTLSLVELGENIPGSYWGESEAGLIGDVLFARVDTPVHSVLHEACHLICMTPDRRVALDRDAGGDYDEENAVCYMQILLGEHLPGCTSEQIMRDMDAWGYTFRLGSARSWFERDAQDARKWLVREKIIDVDAQPTWKVRK